MNSPRTITKKVDYKYINEIIELCENIYLNVQSLLFDYIHLFNEEEKQNIYRYANKIKEYIELLNGFKKLLINGKCHSSIHRKFKIIAQEIFEIEYLLKEYSIKVWKNQLMDVSEFENDINYYFVVYSLLLHPDLNYSDDEQLVLEQYEKRMNMLSDSKRRFLSTSLISNKLTRLFYEAHIAVIVQLDESNYIAANYRDAATRDSMFTNTIFSNENDDDIYTIRRDDLGNIYTGEPATIISTPEFIKQKQLKDKRAITVSEIILDRMKSKTQGILCFVYANPFLSYSRKYAEKLGKKYNLPVIYRDKTLDYIHKDIREYEVYEKNEIVRGIKQYLDKEMKEKIYSLSGRKFDIAENTYLEIFLLASKESIKNEVEAKKIVQNIARQKIKEMETCLTFSLNDQNDSNDVR